MQILDLELEDGPFEFDADEEVLIDAMPEGSGPVQIGDTGLEQVVLFTQGPLRGYVAITDLADWAHLVARSMEEFIAVLRDPANCETQPDEEEDEEGELVDLYDLIDAFADGTRTTADVAAGQSLLGTLPQEDVWSIRFVAQAMWGAKLTTTSEADAHDAIDADEGSEEESTPQRWAAEAAEDYLSDLERWRATRA